MAGLLSFAARSLLTIQRCSVNFRRFLVSHSFTTDSEDGTYPKGGEHHHFGVGIAWRRKETRKEIGEAAGMYRSTRTIFAIAVMLGSVGAAEAMVWQAGDLITYNQADWGGDPATDKGAALVQDQFYSVYTSGFLILGSQFTMTFSNPGAPGAEGTGGLRAYIPAVGAPGALTGSALNPITTSAGTFGGEVLALELNVDLSDAGLLVGTTGIQFGNLILENFTTTTNLGIGARDYTYLNGLTVRQFLADVNTALGGAPSIDSIADLNPVANAVNGSFGNGGLSQFALDHLVAPAAPVCTQPSNICGPAAVPEPSSLALLASGVFGIAALNLRRRNRRHQTDRWTFSVSLARPRSARLKPRSD